MTTDSSSSPSADFTGRSSAPGYGLRSELMAEIVSRRPELSKVMSVLSEQAPPANEIAVPPMPADLLEQLQEHFGKSEVKEPMAIRHQQGRTSLFSQLSRWWSGLWETPMLWSGGLVAAAIVAGFFLLQQRSNNTGNGQATDLVRGGAEVSVPAAPQRLIWRGAADHPSYEAVAKAVSGLEVIDLGSDLPAEGLLLIVDPDAGVSVVNNGQVMADFPAQGRRGSANWAQSLTEALKQAQAAHPGVSIK